MSNPNFWTNNQFSTGISTIFGDSDCFFAKNQTGER